MNGQANPPDRHSAGRTDRPVAGSRGFALALVQPDQAGNVGAAARLAACLGVGLHVVEPCGFLWDDKRIRRAGMDYLERAAVQRHVDWARFRASVAVAPGCPPRRLVLLTTGAASRFDRFGYRPDDVLLLGSESAGVSEEVRGDVDAQVRIPMRPGARSLNMVVAASMVAAHAAARIGLFDDIERERNQVE